jgi:hypothetical protein
MIPEKSIRNEKFGNAKYSLAELLDTVALTREQRTRIDNCIDSLEDAFNEANGN